jgi:predicted O-methyltransferase YrrM
MKTFDEVYEFSLSAEGNGTHDHPLCTATAAELKTFVPHVLSLPTGSRVVELGTYTGRSSSVYLQVQKDLDLDIHLVDALLWEPKHATYAFWNLIVNHFLEVPFTYHKMPTDLVASQWNFPIDFLYIDGWHYAPQVGRDFANWIPFLKPSGVLAVHDSDYHEVAACLDQFVKSANWKLLSEAERMTVWRKP